MNVAFLPDGPKVLSLYEGFFAGGARILHTAVVRALDATTGQQHQVFSLTNRVQREFTAQAIRDDTSYRRLRAAGIPIQALDRDGTKALSSLDLYLLERAVRRSDVIFSLKEQPLAALAKVGTFGRPLITALHRSDPEHSGAALESLVQLHEQGLLSAGVCCAESTQRAYHRATGIPLEKLPVIPNGVDLHKFRPNAETRRSMRAQLEVGDDSAVVLIAARFDEMKNIGLFVAAAGEFVRRYPDAHLVMCGAGMTDENQALTDLLDVELRHWSGREMQVHAMGIQPSMAPFYNAADLVALTSKFGEAAPLCLLEGMASGAVPVTTAVGDAAVMVGDPRLVAELDPVAMAETWAAAYEQREEHSERILRHRQRLSEHKGFDTYAQLINSIAAPAVLSA
ncbi:glycosyltransferase [soil metagenome]